MTKRDELRERRDQILAKARAVAEKAGSEGRELTAAEAEQVNSALAEAKGIGATLAADDRNRALMSELDAQASSAAYDVLGGSGQHLALTGVHAKTMADRIIAGMPRDSMSTKTLAAGQQTTSSILLPQVIATGRPAVSVLDVLPARIVPPIYSFLRQNSRTLAAAPTPAYTAKPVSDVGVVGVENRLRVVATVSSPVDHFLVSDNTNLTAFVTQELVYAIRVCLEREVISGDGTGEHFTGIFVDERHSLADIRHRCVDKHSQSHQCVGRARLCPIRDRPTCRRFRKNRVAHCHKRSHRCTRCSGRSGRTPIVGCAGRHQQHTRRESRARHRRRRGHRRS